MAKPQYIHGEVEVIKTLPNMPNSIGMSGVITAFSEKSKLFSVYFNNGHWVTFEGWTIQKFKEHFKFHLFDEERRFNP